MQLGIPVNEKWIVKLKVSEQIENLRFLTVDFHKMGLNLTLGWKLFRMDLI
jgi:hypothetical protein